MHIEESFTIDDLEVARELVRRHPFATIVTADLRATHMPCLVDEAADGLVVLGHVAKPDPVAASLDGPVLLAFHGPHGYVSASWYRSRDLIPTWNHVTLHVRGRPELIDAPLELLSRTVDHFEAAVPRPWRVAELPDGGRGMASEVVGFRLQATSWHAEAKLSQDKDAERRADVLRGLEAPGPYRNQAVAAAMRAIAS